MKMLWALPRWLAHVIYLLLVAPFLLLGTMCALALADLWRKFLPPIDLEPDQAPAHEAISVVIPNWNGRDLLAANLPSVIAALAFHPDPDLKRTLLATAERIVSNARRILGHIDRTEAFIVESPQTEASSLVTPLHSDMMQAHVATQIETTRKEWK